MSINNKYQFLNNTVFTDIWLSLMQKRWWGQIDGLITSIYLQLKSSQALDKFYLDISLTSSMFIVRNILKLVISIESTYIYSNWSAQELYI